MKLFVILLYMFCMVGFCISHFLKHSIEDMVFWGVLAIINGISMSMLNRYEL